ncbi:MAG: hypothetical protein ACMXYC_01235 [Candidatus Woesearchaeota archaeon]
MPKSEYEIINATKLKSIQKDIESIKKNPLVTQNHAELKDSMNGLRDSLHQMLDIFKKASDEMTLEEKEERMIAKQIKPIFLKVEQIAEQHETIAQGMVTVANRAESTQKAVEQLQKQMDTIMTTLSRLEHDMFMQQKEVQPQAPQQTDPFTMPSYNNQQSFDNFDTPNLPPLSGGPQPPQEFNLPPLEPNALGNKKKGLGSFFKK